MKELIEKIKNCNTEVYSRYGFGWKGAEWHKTTKERLINSIERGNYASYDVYVVNGGLGVSFYSSNDMM